MKRFPNFRQLDQMDCGPTCLKIVSKYYNRDFSIEYLRQISHITKEGVSALDIIDASEAIGLKALGLSCSFETLTEEVPLPAIAYWQQGHFFVVYKVDKKYVYVSDPAFGKVKYTLEKFRQGWITDKANEEGLIILLEPSNEFYNAEDQASKKDSFLNILYQYVKPYHKLIIQLLVGLVVSSLIQLIFPFATQAVVDYGINYENINFIWLILLAQITLFISRSGVRIIQDWLLLHLGMRVNIALLSDFLFKMMALPVSFFDSKMIGDLMRRVEDHGRVQSFITTQTLNILFATFSFITFGIVLFIFSPLICGIYFLGTILYIIWVLFFLKRRAELDYKSFSEQSVNQSSLVQLLNGIEEIKLNGSERKRRWEWESIQIRLHRIGMKSLSLQHFQGNGGRIISELKNIFVTFYAAVLVLDGQLTLGTMLAIQYILGQLNGPILMFIDFVQSFQDAKLSMNRIREIFREEQEDSHLPETQKKIGNTSITFGEGFSFRYGGPSSPLILNNLAFTVPGGKVTAIVGNSGSGKTTLLKLMLKFYSHYQGSMKAGAEELRNIDTKFWRSKCGVVMQDGYIFNDSILSNVTESEQGFRFDQQRLQDAIRIANLQEFIDTLPAGLNTKLGADGISLSGGQNQRILIARAVYKNPEFLFLDEATSSLDANNERVIMDNLDEFFVGKTVVIIAHRLSTVKKADQILVLDGGEIIETGTHQELVKQQGSYFKLIKNQLELGN
ncbi:MAG: peptidase domain-containing ABC transporter [Cyclobacteriaceae bacterium]